MGKLYGLITEDYENLRLGDIVKLDKLSTCECGKPYYKKNDVLYTCSNCGSMHSGIPYSIVEPNNSFYIKHMNINSFKTPYDGGIYPISKHGGLIRKKGYDYHKVYPYKENSYIVRHLDHRDYIVQIEIDKAIIDKQDKINSPNLEEIYINGKKIKLDTKLSFSYKSGGGYKNYIPDILIKT